MKSLFTKCQKSLLITTLLLSFSFNNLSSQINPCNGGVYSAGNDTAVCENYAKLNATPPELGVGEWTIVPGMGSATIVNNNDPKTTIGGLSKGINAFVWSVTYTNCITRDTVIVTNNSPSIVDAGVDQILNGSTTSMNATPPAIGIGEWTILSGSGSFTNVNDHYTNVSQLQKGANIFKWTVTHLNCFDSDVVTITNGLSDDVDAGLNQEICTSTTDLNANEPTIGYGEWSVVRGSGSFNNFQDHKSKVSYISPGKNVYRWTIRNTNSSISDTVVVINSEPTIADAGFDQIVATNECTLNANTPIYGSGKWTLMSGGGTIADESDPYSSMEGLNPGKNILRWTINNSICKSISDVNITVGTTAVSEVKQSPCVVFVYNTPDKGSIIVKASEGCSLKRLMFYNLSGSLIRDKTVKGAPQAIINASHISKGIYIIKVQFANENWTTKRYIQD